VQRAAARTKKDVRSISAEAMTALINYRWPGNVRELEHAIERAVIVSRGASISVRELPPQVTQKSGLQLPDDSLDLEVHERMLIKRALERYRGNRRQAARALNISTVTLWRKMKDLDLDENAPRRRAPSATARSARAR
jgi:DNA-binding NtrC family response regulator